MFFSLRKKRRNLSHQDVLISFSSALNVFSGELFCFCGNSLLGFFVERDKEKNYHGMFISFSCAGDFF
jgi:hypothetical protein